MPEIPEPSEEEAPKRDLWEYTFNIDIEELMKKLRTAMNIEVDGTKFDGLSLKLSIPADLTETQIAQLNGIIKQIHPHLKFNNKKKVE